MGRRWYAWRTRKCTAKPAAVGSSVACKGAILLYSYDTVQLFVVSCVVTRVGLLVCLVMLLKQ